MHGLLVEELKDNHIEKAFGEFGLDFFLVIIDHFAWFLPFVVVLYECTICLSKTYFSCLHSTQAAS